MLILKKTKYVFEIFCYCLEPLILLLFTYQMLPFFYRQSLFLLVDTSAYSWSSNWEEQLCVTTDRLELHNIVLNLYTTF